MANQDKIVKSLEILRILIVSPETSDLTARKKDKIFHCTVIHEYISNPVNRTSKNFLNLINVSFETLLQLCDDNDADIRMVADESLNRITKALLDTYSIKILIELLKEIKKNGAARSLRTALRRFSFICHMVRPSKGKPFVQELVPSFVKIASSDNESVHETMSESLPRIMTSLGSFMSDNNIKILLKVFLQNLQNESTVIRRTAASCIVTICEKCRKPIFFTSFILNELLDLILPINEDCSVNLILGIFNCLKNVIPCIPQNNMDHQIQGSFGVRESFREMSFTVDKMIQVYELCIFYTTHADHNIVNSALETLASLLENCTTELRDILLSPTGITNSRILESDISMYARTLSQMSIATSIHQSDETLEIDKSLMSDLHNWTNTSKLSHIDVKDATVISEDRLSLNNYFDEKSENLESDEQTDNYCGYSNLYISDLNMIDKETDNSLHVDCIKKINSIDNIASPKKMSGDTHDSLSMLSSDDLLEYCNKNINIGCFTDANVPLAFCCRHLSKLFLLSGVPSYLVPDKIVRVSVKSLALNCIAKILNLYPDIFFCYLSKTSNDKDKLGSSENIERHQRISDILLFSNHSDPQLRGVTQILIASLINSILVNNDFDYTAWCLRHEGNTEMELLGIDHLIKIMCRGLEDASSTCARQCLISVEICLPVFLESNNCNLVKSILNILPFLITNPYWLVKVKLIEVVEVLPYDAIYYLIGDNSFQDKILHGVLFVALKDEDSRVRSAATRGIIRIIPHLYFDANNLSFSPIISRAKSYKNNLLNNNMRVDTDCHISHHHSMCDLPEPFCNIEKDIYCDQIEKSLFKIVNYLSVMLLESSSKYLTYGCFEVLHNLSDIYDTITYFNAWDCISVTPKMNKELHEVFDTNQTKPQPIPSVVKLSNTSILLNTSISMLTSSILSHNLICHSWLLRLAGNIYSGIAIRNITPVESLESKKRNPWDFFEDKVISQCSEVLLTHVIKLLNIFSHIIDDVVPINYSKPILPNLPNTSNLSPIKRKIKTDGVVEKNKLMSPNKSVNEKDEQKDKKTDFNTNILGYFAACPHYMKIYELLKTAFTNYKITIDVGENEIFSTLLKTTLETLTQILEIASLNETGRIASEILTYLQSSVLLEPKVSIQCVQQLLKCLFGTNLCSQVDKNEITTDKCDVTKFNKNVDNIYSVTFQNFFISLTSSIHSFNINNKIDEDTIGLGNSLRRKRIRMYGSLRGIPYNADKTSLENYIRLFEPMVIKSLKLYTITSDVKLQCKVLELLNQLVNLRVNYCLLDSEQIFIKFVLEQLEFIEQGQILNTEKLIPKIFAFLVNLSYEKQHSKTIISIPKIINLCDALMASGESPLTHCIPALFPVIQDIFVDRGYDSGTTDLKELEATRDVLFSMLLRLVEYHDVIEMITLIINEVHYSSNSGEKWTQLSKMVVDSLFPLLAQRRVRLEFMNAQNALHLLLSVLDPDVYKPTDVLLDVLFHKPPAFQSSIITMSRWLGSIVSVFLLILQIKEEVLLLHLNGIKLDIRLDSIYDNLTYTYDPLNVSISGYCSKDLPPQMIFTRYIFRVIEVASEKCVEVLIAGKEESHFLQQLDMFLMICLYMFESGSHCIATKTAMDLINKNDEREDFIDIETLNLNFLKIAHFKPILSYRWCYLLILLNYSDKLYWSKVLQINDNENKSEVVHRRPICNNINMNILQMCGVIAFSDYVCENINDEEKLIWFLENHIETLILLSNEEPVRELISAIHRNYNYSGLFLSTVIKYCSNRTEPYFMIKLLKCLENMHNLQSCMLLKYLISKTLNYWLSSISRLADSIACHRIELLLTLKMENLTEQFTKDDFIFIKNSLIENESIRKHGSLVSLVSKLANKCYSMVLIKSDVELAGKSKNICDIELNKTWYLSQVKNRCCQSIYLGKESAELLNNLEYNDIIFIMSQENFNKLILKDCISLSMKCLNSGDKESMLLNAVVDSLMKHVIYLKSLMPKPHQVYCIHGYESTHSEEKYENSIDQLFSSANYWKILNQITPAVISYLELLSSFKHVQINDTYFEDLCKFGVLCLENIAYITIKNDYFLHQYPHSVDLLLRCADLIFQDKNLSNILALDTHISWLCSSVNAIYRLILQLILNKDTLPTVSISPLRNTLENLETKNAAVCCYQLSTMVLWLENIQQEYVYINEFLFKILKSLIICLVRQPVVNSYVLTPTTIWEQEWNTEFSGQFKTQVPALSITYLHDVKILEEFIYRINLIGWRNRQQFEETWMSLLSVLSYSTEEDSLADDITITVQANSLAVQGLTALLLQTLMIPVPGNPNISKYLHIPRNKAINNNSTSFEKLKAVLCTLCWKLKENVHIPNYDVNKVNISERPNIDRINDYTKYSYGQVSIEYLWIASKTVEMPLEKSNALIKYEIRNKYLEDCGIDVHSCIQFLLDLYSQWLQPQNATPLRLLNEVVKSIIAISDLFTEKSQFQWMLDKFLELSKAHPIEDDLLHHQLILGIAKSVAVLIPEIETYEIVKRLLEMNLKSGFLPARLSSLNGILYLLQGTIMANTVIGGCSEEMLLIQPVAIDYVYHHITNNSGVLNKSETHQLLVWTLAFYLVEHLEENISNAVLMPSIIQNVTNLLMQKKLSLTMYIALLQGLERLIMIKRISSGSLEVVTKLSIDLLNNTNPLFMVPALQLLFVCMYTDAEERFDKRGDVNVVENDPEVLVQSIEKISAIFNRIKKGYPFEVEIICSVLPRVLNDFFPPSEIITRVIGEFLSPQQPHPKFLSGVVFEIFERAYEQSQLPLLQEWVVFSLSNFTQSFPIGMTTWCLTCFFISASKNKWLRSFFPHVQSRIGKYEQEDKRLFCLSGKEFYNQLTTDNLKITFTNTFEKVADQPEMPFKDLLVLLNN